MKIWKKPSKTRIDIVRALSERIKKSKIIGSIRYNFSKKDGRNLMISQEDTCQGNYFGYSHNRV